MINIVEIKFCEKPFALDKEYAKALLNKVAIYREVTKTEKQLFVSLVTSSHLKDTIYSKEVITSEATLTDLFVD